MDPNPELINYNVINTRVKCVKSIQDGNKVWVHFETENSVAVRVDISINGGTVQPLVLNGTATHYGNKICLENYGAGSCIDLVIYPLTYAQPGVGTSDTIKIVVEDYDS